MREHEKKTDRKKVVIIGGGPAGLTAAYDLSTAGVASVVLEKDRQVGGISKTVNYKDYHFDLGGHRFFTKVLRVERMWKEVLGDDFLTRSRLSRIFYNKRFFYYPLKPFNTVFGLGLVKSFLILASYLYSHVFPLKTEDTFEEWVTNRFGRRLYKTFFKTYTEKVWGIPCSEIRAEWAAQRIKGLSLVSAIRNALVGQRGGGNVITTLIDSLNYPRLGPGMMWEAVRVKAEEFGSEVRLGSEVVAIVRDNNRIKSVEVSDGSGTSTVAGTHFISSMPVRELVGKLKPPAPAEVVKAAESLRYRDFLTVALIVDKKDVFPDNWIYVHEPDVRLGRIQNFKNWSPYMVPDPEKTCLGLEYFCFEGDELWSMPDEDLIELGKREIETLALTKASDVTDGSVVRMPKAYPIYDSGYEESFHVVREFLDNVENLQLVGRNGMHKYNNQDHSMLTAMLAVENVLGARHNLWEVNEEQEYHEEISRDEPEREIPDEAIIRAFSRMDNLSLAAALGCVSGLAVFFATLWLVIKGGPVVGPNLRLLDQYFIGYTVTLKGAFAGLGHGFVWGFLLGWFFSYVRNFSLAYYIYRAKKRAELLNFRDFLDHF